MPFCCEQNFCTRLCPNQLVKEDNEMAANTTAAGYSLEIAELIRSNLTPKRMQEQLSSYHENDIALALDLLNKTERTKLYQILDSEALADILEYSDHIAEYVQELSIRKSRCIFPYGNL